MIVIVDYGVGNLASVLNIIRKAGGDAIVSSSAKDIRNCDRLFLPGVGAFDHGMSNLEERRLIQPIQDRAQDGAPILGICLGMQLLSRGSEEGQRPGLGLVPASFKRFADSTRGSLRVPHVGWNTINVVKTNDLVTDSDEELRYYFVHSYYAVCDEPSDVIATTMYGHEFPCIYGRGKIYGCQFHPEKSHRFGLQLIRRFLEL